MIFGLKAQITSLLVASYMDLQLRDDELFVGAKVKFDSSYRAGSFWSARRISFHLYLWSIDTNLELPLPIDLLPLHKSR